MFERDVTISLNADVSNYSSSLAQAIAITQQYSSAADSALGNVAKLNSAMVGGLTKLTSGLTGPQKMVTDTAAAYQQQLSGLQASAVVTGQSFGQLEKSTRALARSFPIGMGQAVQQVQALQSAGVTSQKEIERLATSFTKLGAANSAFGPELGQQMLQVTRAFGNSTTQVDALGDSLTTVSKQWGANASGILTFSKAIAPIASTVGMSQTQVMGLSAAMSRLGEDGYMAANSFNKVLLDMNRGIREGGPELKVYADLLNMTSDSLKNLFKNDPTEVLVRFTEAVAKAGPEAQKTLEALGLDGVRTTRSITALSRSGDLRQIIDTSVGAYGSGSTEKAAEAAFGGVNDQMTRLSESMRQTVASAGKPYLGFMEDVLGVANKLTESTNKVMENDTIQKIATLGIIGGVGAGLALKGLSLVTLGSAAKNVLTSVRGSAPVQGFAQAREAARGGVMPGPGSTMAQRLGAAVGQAQGPVAAPGATPGIGARVGATINAAANLSSRLIDSQTNEALKARGAATIPVTPTGAALRAATGDLLRNRDMASLRAFGSAGQMYMGGLGAQGGVAGALGRAGLYAVETTRTAGAGLAAAGRGIARIGGSGLGQMALLGGVMAGGYAMYQGSQERQAQLDDIKAGTSNDIYASFNQFAEAAGRAGRGLVDFTAAVSQATSRLAQDNTTYQEAGTLSAAEASAAKAAGYTRAFNIVGDAARGAPQDVEAIAQQALSVLGSDPQTADVARVVSDVANQTSVNTANAVGTRLEELLGSGQGGVDTDQLVKDVLANTGRANFFGMTSEESATLAKNLGSSLTQQSYEISQVYGNEAAAIENLANAQDLFLSAKSAVGTTGRRGGFDDLGKREAAQNISMVLQGQLGLTDEQMDFVFGSNPADRAQAFGELNFEDVVSRLQQYESETGVRPSVLDTVDEAKSRGISLYDPSYESFNELTEVEKRAYDVQNSFEDVTNTSSTLSESLYGVNEAARSAGVTLNKLATMPDERRQLSPTQDLVLEAVTNKNEGTVNAAAQALAQQALDEARGDISMAASRLRQEQAVAQEGTAYKAVTDAASQQLQMLAAPRQAAQSQTTTMLQQYRQGQAAEQMGFQSDFNLEQARQVDISAGKEQQAAFTSMARNFLLQQRQMEVQMQQMREQAGQQTYQMQRDYNLQVQYANEDFNTSRQRSTRDFNISMDRMERDYLKGRARATRDFRQQAEWAEQDYNRSKRRATQDFNISMRRMEEDYTKQRSRTIQDFQISTERAERDYQRNRARATRDFGISMTRMEEDYGRQKSRATDDYNRSVARSEQDYQTARARANRDFERQQAYSQADFDKSRLRSTQDFNKQLRRLVEDQAKSLYDPYKRIQAQLVMDAGQLVTNLADQNQALAKQMESVDRLRTMGLSSSAIDVLGLSDTKNAQQVERLLADTVANPALIEQLNAQIAGRVNLSQMFVSDEDNQQTRRMREDFESQMNRAAEDFATASARAAEQFATSMMDMESDYKTQMSRASEDFNLAMSRMAEDYATAVTRAREDQARALQDMAEDHRIAMEDAADDLALALSRMDEDYRTAVQRAGEDFTLAMQRMDEDYRIMTERSLRQFVRMMRDMQRDFRTARKDAREDFNRSMEDAEADFRKQLARMATSLKNALSDIGAGLAIAERAAAQSLIAYGQTVAEGEREIFRDFGEYIASLPTDLQDNMGESMRGLLEYMRDRFPGLFKEIFPNGVAGVFNDPWFNSRIVPGNPTPPYGSGPGGVPDPDTGPSDFTTGDFGGGDFDTAGASSGEGFLEGLARAIREGKNIIEYTAGLVIDWWKDKLGISSPSKVFIGLGEDTVDGFLKGIKETMPNSNWARDLITALFSTAGTWLSNIDVWIGERIGDKWDELKANMPDVGKAVRDLFTDPGKFFSDLKTWIPEKLGKGWDKITANLPDVGQAIRTAFTDPGKFFTDLKTWIPEKIGKGWDKITAGIPGAATVKDAVKDAFKQAETWLGNFDQWVKTALPAWSKFTDIFKGILIAPMEAAVNELIRRWNDFKLEFGPITVEAFGQKVELGPWSIDTPYKAPVDWYAQGGIVSGAQVIGVGEAGPEAVIPLNQRGARVMADALKTYLDETVWDGSLGGMSGGAQVINVEMADINIDLTDSGSQFSQQARELLQRVKDATLEAGGLMQASGASITGIINDLTVKLESLAEGIADAFTGTADDVDGETKSIAESLSTMADTIDTDLTDLTTGFKDSVTSIIDQTDKLIKDAIQRIEDFANTDFTPPGRDDGTTDDGTTDDGTEDGNPGGTPASPKWTAFSSDYGALGDPDKTFVNSLFAGKEPTAETFGALTSSQQDILHRAIIGGLTEEEKTSLLSPIFANDGEPGTSDYYWNFYEAGYTKLQQPAKAALNKIFGGKPLTQASFSGLSIRQQAGVSSLVYQASMNGGTFSASDNSTLQALFPSGGGAPAKPNTTFSNYSNLQSALGKSDQDFLTQSFGGTAPTSKTWAKVSESQREALIKALEDKNLTKDEREDIGGLSLPNLGKGGGESGGPGSAPDPEVKQWWDVFREGYRKLGDYDRKLVDRVFGGTPTLEDWVLLSETQQRRLRDAVRDGTLDKNEAGTVGDIDSYRVLGRKIVEYASTFKGRPYKPELGKTPAEDPANPPDSFDCSTFTSWVYKKFGKTLPTYSDSQWGMGKDVSDNPMPGDLVFFHSDGPWRTDNPTTGHVGIYAGNGMMWDAAGAVADTGYHGVSGALGYRRYFAEGGIVNRRQEAVIGEAGPEVVVPLNERGAEYFANVMQRYAAPTEARQAMVSPYSTPVSVSITQTYDNRTMFTGPIEVAANNPDEMAAKVAAKQRRQRLSQPVGSAR